MSDSHNEIPEWVTAALDLKEESISQLQVCKSPTSVQGPLDSRYYIFLEYLAHRAVDVSQTFIPSAPDDSQPPMKSRRLTLNRREYPGTLSTLQVADKIIKEDIRKAMPYREGLYGGNEGSSDNEDEAMYPEISFGYGRSKLKHEDTFVCVSHEVSTKFRDVSSIIFYAASPDYLRSLVNNIFEWTFKRRQPDRKPRDGKYELYTMELKYREARWFKHGWKKSRDLDTIFLPQGEMGAILSDFQSFNAKGTKEWYVKHGLPHRRSYLFYGPPGTGKTSTIRALAGKLKLAACFMELGDNDVSNMHLTTALRNLPLPAMLVIEDVDAVFNEDRKTKNQMSPLTFSGLLNALDGLISTDGVLTVMTTNHPEKLDPALVRAGRIDRKFEFKKPKNKQFVDMFMSFYPDADQKLAQEFADIIVNRKEKEAKSIATLMELFIYAREGTARECVDRVDEFFKEFYPKSGHDHLYWLYS